MSNSQSIKISTINKGIIKLILFMNLPTSYMKDFLIVASSKNKR